MILKKKLRNLQLKQLIFQRGRIKTSLTKLKNYFATLSQKDNTFDTDITALAAPFHDCKEKNVELKYCKAKLNS